MFNKVLIANRGAIAVRIVRTLKRLGIHSLVVYADSDRDSLHVSLADEAIGLGEGPAEDTYCNIDKIISIAKRHDADAIHPGYGFLSENPVFVEACEKNGFIFVGPTNTQIADFGLKHRARAIAEAAAVPLMPGTPLLSDRHDAQAHAESLGYPVILKSTAGGGGIGMQRCEDAVELDAAWDSVRHFSARNFSNSDVYLEKFIARARHIEVQVLGDGRGGAVALGERDCSTQRRNQKVIEECPAPNLDDGLRQRLAETATRLLASTGYLNAGTVEFIVDDNTGSFFFLEVNTRLQVEHGVTEAVYGVDLVEWQLRIAVGNADLAPLAELRPRGHALQARVYAEDALRNFQPSAGLLTHVDFPERDEVRIDSWISAGVEVSPYFDPMLAKLIVHRSNREEAVLELATALEETRLYGCETNLGFLRAFLADPALLRGEITTRYLDSFVYKCPRLEVLDGGTLTTVQDFPGRAGYWDVGVPPSGPFDSYAFRLGNRLLGNSEDAAGLEITLRGPTLSFTGNATIAITGANIEATLDGEPLDSWVCYRVAPGQTLKLGDIRGPGARSYLCVGGGLRCPDYLGAKATFTLGQFGGHCGRALRSGDVLPMAEDPPPLRSEKLGQDMIPCYGESWELRVIYGPHGAPDYFTNEDIETFFGTEWEVHYNSSRTGIRLNGPKPVWARSDGGDAGLHPSNIHDNAYAFGTVDFTGDMPVVLGPDGPSLGGFVCPATVIAADLWKLGQLSAGHRIRFVPVEQQAAVAAEAEQSQRIAGLQPLPGTAASIPSKLSTPVVRKLLHQDTVNDVCIRVAGDHFLLVEYGPQELDLRLRLRVQAMLQWLQENPIAGLRELTPGIRSLQVHYDSQVCSQSSLIDHLLKGEDLVGRNISQLSVPSRIVHLPLSWDDEACHRAIEHYSRAVRENAPWCPSNLEFIRRINGLNSIDDVRDIVFSASYLVLGLGDVYLGAPVATPVDPRHRLVTTKYNPARTWTAENSVGIGGAYLCVYGMEGPGGYQFVGRTLQVWNRFQLTREFEQPWLLRHFDQLRFYPVSHEELTELRSDFLQGRHQLRIEESEFGLDDHEQFLVREADSIQEFVGSRQSAFDAELARWHADGQFNFSVEEPEFGDAEATWPEGCETLLSPVIGTVWQLRVSSGQQVRAGDTVAVLESMKMEIPLQAPCDALIREALREEGSRINAGQPLFLYERVVAA
jgi:urea carboxylase